jgi:hypothetical protein
MSRVTNNTPAPTKHYTNIPSSKAAMEGTNRTDGTDATYDTPRSPPRTWHGETQRLNSNKYITAAISTQRSLNYI